MASKTHTDSQIYNDRDYFDNKFKEIGGRLEDLSILCNELKGEIVGTEDKPGLRTRVADLEKDISRKTKTLIVGLTALSGLYIKESRDFVVNLIKNWIV